MGVLKNRAGKRCLAGVAVGVGLVFASASSAPAASTISVSLNAPVLATISVSTGSVSCPSTQSSCPGATITGLIRSSRNQMSRIVVSATSDSPVLSPFTMTCADHSTGTLHGVLTLAAAAPIAAGADVSCASWAANAAGNVIAIDDTMTFTNTGAPLDTTLNYTVSLVVS
jgi:hypothetical protein